MIMQQGCADCQAPFLKDELERVIHDLVHPLRNAVAVGAHPVSYTHLIWLLSIYVLMQKLGLLGSYYALMISYVVFTLPVGTWTLKTYFDQLPEDVYKRQGQ